MASAFPAPRACAALDDPDLASALLADLAAAGRLHALLVAGLKQGNAPLVETVQARLLHLEPHPCGWHTRLTLLYASVVAGCACSGDPTPEPDLPEAITVDVFLDCTKDQARLDA